MEAHIAEWLGYVRRNRSPHTVKQYTATIEGFRACCADRSITTTTVADIEKYLDLLLTSRGHNTVNLHLCVLKSFWTWQHRRHPEIPNVAAEVPRLRPDDPVQRFLSDEEYAAVLSHCIPLARDLITLYANTGLRRAEMLALRWDDIAPDLRSLRVHKGKGSKTRTVPLNIAARDILVRDRANDSFSFLARWGSSVAHNRLCARLAGLAHIPPFGPHALRHFFATVLIKRGVPIKVVSKILGHSSISTTEKIYIHLAPVDLLGATDVL